MNLMEQLERLCLLPGVSGYEKSVRDEICNQLDGHCEYQIDKLGNVLVHKKGVQTPKNKIYISAHMDEVGFIITNIEENGLLRFQSVGGFDPRVLLGRLVEVGEQQVRGIIGAKAIHMLSKSEEEKPVEIDHLMIDIGTDSKEETLKVVRPGERASFVSTFQQLGENRLLCKAFDDRVGCAILLDMCLSELPYDCIIAFNVGEEVGLVGGTTAAYQAQADIGIAVDCTAVSDIGGSSPEYYVGVQGDGPVVSFKDGGAVYDQELFHLALDTGKQAGIPCQSKRACTGANEAKAMQIARGGMRIMAISIPGRYIHSACSVVHKEDVVNTRLLLEKLLPALAQVEKYPS